MTDIQLPDTLLDLFAAVDVADNTQVVILLLSAILGLLLLLIVIIAVRGRSAGEGASASQPSLSPAASDDQTTERPTPPQAALTEDSPEASAESEMVEDFRIFKKPKTGSGKAARTGLDTPSAEQLSTTEHLRLIEKNMIRLRDLYQGGHITRDMYIDETRSLYHQARGLSSVS